MLLQAACAASCRFILITLAATVGMSQTLDLVLVERVVAAWLEEGGEGPALAAAGLSPAVSPDVGAFFFLLFFNLRFAQESYLVGSAVGK